MASPFDIAGWVLDAGWKGADAVTATAVGVVAADPSAPGGLFGLGNTPPDGPGQARTAFAAWRAGNGFGVFPAFTAGRHRLFIPVAVAAVTAAEAARSIARQPANITEAVDVVAEQVPGVRQVTDLTTFLTSSNAWERVVKVTVGLILITTASMYLAVKSTASVVFYPLRKLDDTVDAVIGRTGKEFMEAQSARRALGG